MPLRSHPLPIEIYEFNTAALQNTNLLAFINQKSVSFYRADAEFLLCHITAYWATAQAQT